MRLILINPHTFAYGKTVSAFIFKKRAPLKYDFLCEFFIKNKERNTAFYIDGTRTSFNISWPFFPKVFSYAELLFWMVINKINPFKIKVYFDINELNPKEDVLFTFSRSIINVNKKNQAQLKINQFKGIIFIHLTHYFQEIRKLSQYLNTLHHYVAVAENDLSKNPFFSNHFPNIDKVYQLPYAFSERFVAKVTDYDKRINKCMAMGTMCPVVEPDFFKFFGKDIDLQPMRRRIFQNSKRFALEIDSLIKEFKEIKNIKKIESGDSLAVKLVKKILPYVFLEKILPAPQKKYFQFDIVEKYNQYKMFVCPEEIIGLPSINTFEGMACQNAYLGIDSPMFTNIGMKHGEHYISYEENNLDDLVSKIRYYQNHPEELKKIAQEGYKLVHQNFSRKKVADKFWQDLVEISNNFKQNNKVSIHCSFEKK